MLLIIGTVRLAKGDLSAAVPAMKRMAQASRMEDGCLEYGYAQDVFDPGLLHVREVWRDQATLDRHFRSEHMAQWRAAWPSLGIRDRDLRVYCVGDARPI